jgi:hypothetical protein
MKENTTYNRMTPGGEIYVDYLPPEHAGTDVNHLWNIAKQCSELKPFQIDGEKKTKRRFDRLELSCDNG